MSSLEQFKRGGLAFRQAKECANCGTRFLNKGIKKRKRVLIGREEVLDEINFRREELNQNPLVPESIICQECFNIFHYSSSVSSCSETTVDEDENIEEPESANASQIDVQENLQGNDQITDNPCAPPTENVQFVPVSEDICSVCSLLFQHNLKIRKIRLSTAPLVVALVNGERRDRRDPLLSLENIVCENCYILKLRRFHEMWRNLPGTSAMQPLEIPMLSQQSTSSLMETSQPEISQRSPIRYIDSDNEYSDDDDEDQQMDTEKHAADSSSSDESTSDSDDAGPPKRKKLALHVETMSLPIKSFLVTGHTCFLCKRGNVRTRLTKSTRMFIFKSMRIFLSRETRICKEHTDTATVSRLNSAALQILKDLPTVNVTEIKAQEIAELLNYLGSGLKHYELSYGRLAFSEPEFYSDNDFFILLGITKHNFNHLHLICEPFMRNTKARTTQDGLAMFLMKMRVNLSDKALATLFHTNRFTVSKVIKTVHKILMDNFVPLWLGFSHISRDRYISDKTSNTARVLTECGEEEAVCVIDGTYLYYQKSANYHLQRKTYSLHKYKNLLKAMMVVSTRGYILAAEGPYYGDGDNNDSNILKNMMKDNDGFRSFFKEGDYIIEDRGFRDSNSLLTDMGFSVKMPHFLGKRKQHPTSEANESRLVTKLRWIVESVNGRIKNVFRFFRDTISNHYIRNNRGFEMFQIACAFLNAFHPLIFNDDETDAYLAEQMKTRSELPNLLKSHLEDERFIRMTKEWKKVCEDSLVDFPRLTESQLRQLTFGVYQLKQARSYMADSVNESGTYDIFYHDNLQCNAVRFKIHSRHRKGQEHSLWIGYNNLGKGPNSITGWYCQCANGSRVVGCCAHIAAVIWYLSYARYCAVLINPGANLADNVRDARTYQFANEFVSLPPDEEAELACQIARASGINVASEPQSGNSETDSDD